MKSGYTELCLHNFLDRKLINVGKNIGASFAYSEMVKYFSERGEEFAVGEYWGKLVRGACYAYRYHNDQELKDVLLGTAADMLAVRAKNGDLSPVAPKRQPQGNHGSDIWERKYIIVGFIELYLTFGNPEFLECAKGEVLHLSEQVGVSPKTPITETGWAFFGIESSSILYPVMQVYKLTGDARVLDFAKYIVDSGCCKKDNLFEAILNGIDPKDFGSNGNPYESIAKAYEMMSCVEGLVLYYEVTKEEKWLKCANMFIDKLFEQEITELGSGGADQPYNLNSAGIGEQWNYARFEQANPLIQKTMETCVTVYFIKLCNTLYKSTHDMRLMEQIERSYYNALLGACSPREDYFDYFMKFNGRRNGEVNFGHTIGGMPISCCSANGITGIEMYPELCHTVCGSDIYVNLYAPYEIDVPVDGGRFSAVCETEYPKMGSISFTMRDNFGGKLYLRVPSFAIAPELTLNGKSVIVSAGDYAIFDTLKSGDIISLSFDLSVECVDIPNSEGKVLYRYGNLVLSRDKRFDRNYNMPFKTVNTFELLAPEGDELVRIRLGDAIFIDYKSAGGTWDDSSEFYTILTRAK